MARKKNHFGAVDDFITSSKQEIQEVQQVHEVQQVQEKILQQAFDLPKEKEESKEYGTTQGRKGHKLKRINMAFSDDNHEYIKKESRHMGISATEFVNDIIGNYRKGILK